MGLHEAGANRVSPGVTEPDSSAPVLTQYQSGAAAYWVAKYCLKTGDPVRVRCIVTCLTLSFTCTDQQSSLCARLLVCPELPHMHAKYDYVDAMQMQLQLRIV